MKKSLPAIVAVSFLTLTSAARAEQILDFNMDAVHPATASISYDGLGGPLVGAHISVDTVTGLNTPFNDGTTFPITNGTLSFNTGNFAGPLGPLWVFNPGGSVSVTGDVGFGASLLLSGVFTEALVVSSTGSDFKVVVASFLDVKDDAFALLYGVPVGSTWAGNINLSFNAPGSPPGAFASTQILSGDVVNTVPEPGSILIQVVGAVGLAAAGLGTRIRRRLRAAA